jgi:NADPH:quinone reductase
MKRVVVDHYGGPEVLKIVEDRDPRPAPGEVRVRVLAAGVSYTDAMLRAGTYLGVPKPPFTPATSSSASSRSWAPVARDSGWEIASAR